MPATYTAEYAKSGRAKCKKCQEVIDKDVLRIGAVTEREDHLMTSWYHPQCLKVPKVFTSGDMTFEDIANVDTLEDADQRTLRDRWFTGEMQAEAPVKRKADVTPKKAGKKAKGPQMEVTKLEKEDYEEEIPEDPRVVELKEKYGRMNSESLRRYLQCNGMVHSQLKKDELVTRCVDGELFGAWPRCPLCKKGRTRLQYDNPRDLSHGGQGNWSCGGYSDEGAHFKCKLDENEELSAYIERPAWKEPVEGEDYGAKKKPEVKMPEQLKPEDDPAAAPGVSNRERADELAKRARAAGIMIPLEDSKARVDCGVLISQFMREDGYFDFAAALARLAELKGTSAAAGGAGDDDGGDVDVKNLNPEISALFEQLSKYEKMADGGAPFKAAAYHKVYVALKNLPYKVTSGKMLTAKKTKVEGVGKASAEKVDEWLTTGKIRKLEEYKEQYGELP